MAQYLIRRLLISILTLIAISMVVFGILALAPGDPLADFAKNPNVSEAQRAAIRKKLGLDDPVHVQYYRWASNYVRGDWSDSISVRGTSVRDLVLGRLGKTLSIVGTAFLISVLIAIPIGVISALKQYSLFDQIVTTFAFLGFSLPTFFTGLLLIWVFSVKLNWLNFVYDDTAGFWETVKTSIMPITVLALAGSASLTRFVRASMLEVINQDYVRTARAKGMKERTIIILHAMRNAMIPVVTIIALSIPEIFGGAIVTEQIFRVNGIGDLLVKSIGSKDTPTVMAITFGVAILVVIFNVIADLLYAVLDPRIKLS